ncbi:MAG: DNA polymerase III subunit beta [Candidatus Latescibacteria bacterium]|nr:DNA polymerase III subunit beta [Candidatus Latescibacterota bacterium]NIM22664.1 DNA polymerase III subunit beta [Candidatus Latescibacterota bacterium]NIM64953.1 DNA polymerase III subunit beta [Candidatus Latescibacterota bacterium]NIO01468.1 DNA polymerase III subunit beta [Candidatus Latescibacterota bacterium]NIO27978.1 DNA polymerase III subunit beta [Candidatus Latescibacterota bacterium]
MKISLAQKVLTKKIQGISAVVPTKTSLPILSTFLMEVKKDKVHLTANDLDVSLTTIVDCEIEGEGTIAVPGKKFFEIARSLPDDTVEITAEAEKLGVKCKRSRFRIVGKSAEEFPKLPEQKPLASFTVKTETINSMIEKTIYAVSNDLTRPSLCGVLWESKGGNITMVATDGHRLAKVDYEGDFKNLEGKEFIVSPKALNILRSLIDEKEEVKISLAENHITFDLEDSIIYSRLIEGPFPDYNQVIPKQNEKELVVNREELTDACRRVSILSSVITHQVKLSITPEVLTLSVNTPDVGEAVEELRCRFKGDSLEIGYNARYLLDILKTMETEEVAFLLDRSDNTGIVVPVDDGEDLHHQCLLMPLRLSD